MDRFDAAIVQKRMAVELDPLTPALSNYLGYTLLEAGRAAEALDAFRTAIELDSTYWSAHMGLATYYTAAGRLEDALRGQERAVALASTNATARAGLAEVLALNGRTAEARALIAELEAEAARTGIYATRVALAFAALDDLDAALSWLERAYRQKHPELRLIGRVRYGRLAGDPRFRELRRRIGLPS